MTDLTEAVDAAARAMHDSNAMHDTWDTLPQQIRHRWLELALPAVTALAPLLVECSRVHLVPVDEAESPVPALNPDCRARNHRACSGTAWDDSTDMLVRCECPCHEAAAA